MRPRIHRSPYGRVVFAVAALYALLLQSFLAAATPTDLPNVAGLLCAELAGGSHQPAGGGHPSGHDEGCCTAACFANPVPTPLVLAAAFTPPAFVSHWWAKAGAAAPVGPRGGSASARGPPLV
jgi:hypothetical protein